MLRRMLRPAAALGFGAGALVLALGQAAHAGDAGGLLCWRDEVAQVVMRELRARDYYAQADFSVLVERPTPEANVMHCTIGVVRCLDRCASSWPGSPVVEAYGYRVRLVGRRFTVEFDLR